jgi:hypothetical protein
MRAPSLAEQSRPGANSGAPPASAERVAVGGAYSDAMPVREELPLSVAPTPLLTAERGALQLTSIARAA